MTVAYRDLRYTLMLPGNDDITGRKQAEDNLKLLASDMAPAGGPEGHENPPWIQRVYWAVTEAATAQALLSASDAGLSTIQGVSIVAGLPYTIAICYCCTSLYRALKREMRDEDIMAQRHGFVVSSLDILELYSPEGMPAQSPSAGDRFKSNIIALFFPYKGLKTAAVAAYNDDVMDTSRM